MSLEELLKKKNLAKKDYRDETPEEREARIQSIEEYQAANPETGAEEGDFSDYLFPVKGAVKSGVKSVIRNMAESGAPKKGVEYLVGRGVKQIDQAPMLRQSGLEDIARTGGITESAIKKTNAEALSKIPSPVKTADDIVAKQAGKQGNKFDMNKTIAPQGTVTQLPEDAAKKLKEYKTSNPELAKIQVFDYAKRKGMTDEAAQELFDSL